MNNSRIAWTTHTFNPWWGCTKVSPACDHCYAESLSIRYRRGAWGKNTLRQAPSEAYWRQPLKWNAAADEIGARARVFCLSMGDLFEVHPALPPLRARLWDLIRATPWLDWLLLTKRPAGFRRLLPLDLLARPNVWPGVTVETAAYTTRLDALVKVPATGPRWVSYEPALGPVDFRPWLPALDWVIVGGESGAGARPFDLAWARRTVAVCRAWNTAAFVKQLGARPTEAGVRLTVADHHDPAGWPADLRVQEFPRGAR
jgi:protein gp37